MNPQTAQAPPPTQQTNTAQFGNYSNWAQQEMSKGFTPGQLQQTLQAKGINTSQGQGNQPSWWQKLLPTAGGVLGGIAGSLTATPFIGGVGGAAAGDALGKALENELTGQSDLTSGVAGSAVQGAVGQGIGGAIGSGLGMLAGKVFAPIAGKLSTQLVAGQAPGITKDLAEYFSKMGLTDLGQATKMSDVITGGAGQTANIDGRAVVNKFVEDTLQNQGPKGVPLADLSMNPITPKNGIMAESDARASGNILQDLLDKNYLGGKNAANGIRTNLNSIFGGIKQDIGGNANPLDALNAQREVSRLANMSFDAAKKTRNADMLNVANVYNQLAQTLKDRMGLDAIKVAPEDAAAIAADVQKFGGAIHPGAANAVAKEITDAANSGEGLTLAGLRNMESNWVQVKGAVTGAAERANKQYGMTASDVAQASLPIAGAVTGVGGIKSLLGAGAGLGAAGAPLEKIGAGAFGNLSKLMGKAGASKLIPLLSRIGAISTTNLPNYASNPVNTPGGAESTLNAAPGAAPAAGGQAMQQDPLSQVFQTLLAQEQAGAGVTPNSGSMMSELGTLAPLLRRQQLAAPLISNIQPTFEQAGGAQGPLSGLLAQATGAIPGTAANTYQRQQQAAAAMIAQLLGISPQAAGGVLPMLPQSPQGAATQMGGVGSILSSLQAGA